MSPRVALLTVKSPTGEAGGAERFYDGLTAALNSSGIKTDCIDVTAEISGFDDILRSYLSFYDLDLSIYDGVISTKAPSFAARHRNHTAYLLHTIRTFYDMFDETFSHPSADLIAQRDLVRRLDTAALTRPSIRDVFVVGGEVKERLQSYNGVASKVLYHPTNQPTGQTGQPSPRKGNYVLMPGRLHRWKRVDLVLEASRHFCNDIELIVSGVGEDEARLKSLAVDIANVTFLGHVSDAALADLYAGALAVAFSPIREDYGLITIEAFLNGKPVVTCSDSGEPARIVKDGVSGFVCPPDPATIAKRLDWLFENATRAEQMGAEGKRFATQIGWENVCSTLVHSLNLDDEPA